MFIQVTKHNFINAFHNKDRGDQFTYEALCALFEYLDESDTELDVIGLCCDFVEFESLAEFQEQYGNAYQTMEDIEHETIVIPVDGSRFIVGAF
jgi:hypothetical protein